MSNCVAMLSRTAARLPQKNALICERRSLTFANLDSETTCLAHGLRNLNLKHGAILPIMLHRGCNVATALLAGWKAGLTVCVIDESYPTQRQKDIREQCGTDVLLDENLFNDLLIATTPLPTAPLPQPSAHDPALAVFTSGSTGRPKGVLLPHQALGLAVQGVSQWLSEDDIMLSTASQAFIAIMLDLISPLVLGVTVNIASDAVRKDVQLLAEHIRANNISASFMAPQMAAPFLEIADGSLRLLFTGSERVRRLFSNQTAIINTYGASETCGPLVSFRIDRLYDNTPVGRPYPGSNLFLLDSAGRPAQQGEIGEICIQGQIATGYLHQSELTAQRFAPAPEVTGNNENLFRTGDLGRLLPDGTLEYVQRKDWMLKIRGFRVEPGEIEAAMLRTAPLEKVVVTGFEDACGQTRLYACYTAHQPVESLKLREALEQILPGYMIPSFLEQVETLPLNANGKIDRKRIAPPDLARLRPDFIAPETELEKKLCTAFSRILAQENIGLNDNFMNLGGNSISAMRVQALMGCPGLSAALILRECTPRAIANYLARKENIPNPIKLSPEQECWPLTFSERQMAAEQSLDPDSVAYNINLAFRIRGELDMGRLRCALGALSRKHRILRSFYPLHNGEYCHCLLPEEMEIPLDMVSCAELEAQQRIAERNKPFDLAKGPLVRASVLKIGVSEFILHFALHHIVMDGLSVGPLLDTFAQAYIDAENEREAEAIRPDYLDLALHLANEPKPSADFFTSMFDDGVPENEMPSRSQRPEILPCANASVRASIPFAALEQRARATGVTPYVIMIAAMGITLGKYCGSEDITLGTAINCRQLPETASMVGMFVNLLPLRLRPASDMSLTDFIRQTGKLVNEAFSNGAYPFSELVPLLAPDRNPSRAPIFDVLVNYLDEIKCPDLAGAGLAMSSFPLPVQSLPMDLTLELRHCNDTLEMELLYSNELYDPKIVADMLEHYKAVLKRIASGDDMRVLAASELTEAQQRLLLEDFAAINAELPPMMTVVSAFRDMARLCPDRRAAALGDNSLTYAELDRLSDSLAGKLAANGIGCGGVVGILVRRGFMMPIGALGVLKIGAAYLPLDPSYPTERLEYMLTDSGASILLADADLLDKVPGFTGVIMDAGDFLTRGGKSAPCVAKDLPPAPMPDDLLTLIYTSGTTGKPKGVMISHANVANFCRWYARHYALSPSDVVAAYASFGFDACLMDMFPALTHGASIQIIPEEMRLDLPGLNECFEKYGVSLAFLTTQLGRQFAETMPNRSLRVLAVGGETLTPLDPPANFALDNAYGPTECTIFTTTFRMDGRYDRVPLGKPLDNMRLYIMDKHGSLAPVGTGGELCIAGPQVAMGYLNHPELTAEKFTLNPFTAQPGYERIYHTGDIARMLPDGNLDFMGRRDFQVKIRGFRVELTEIEGRIRQHPDISDAAVVALDAPGGGKCAAAYVVMRDEQKLDVDQLNAFIAAELPPYMIPAAITSLDAIPLNPNGKVDRRKLPQPDFTSALETKNPDEGSPQPESILAGIVRDTIADILGHTQFGRASNLLRAGLASLSAIRLAAMFDDRFGAAPAVRDIMADPTPLGVENALVHALLIKKQNADIVTQKCATGSDSSWPLAANQLGIYYDCMKHPGTLAYNVPFKLELSSAVSPERLAASLRKVIDAHPSLNVRLKVIDGDIYAVPLPISADIPCITLDETSLDQHCSEFVRPFDMETGPLWRAEIVMSGDRVTLLWDAHHVMFDGASLDILLRSLAVTYASGTLPQNWHERLSTRDWSLEERSQENSRQLQEDKEWFARLFRNFEAASQIPPDLPPTEQKGALAEAIQPLDANAIEKFCHKYAITPAALCLAAAGYAICRWTHGQDIWLSAISSGRSNPGLRNTVGMFVHTVPLHISLGEDLSRIDYVRIVQNSLNESVSHEAYPFAKICEEYVFAPHIMYACELGIADQVEIEGSPAIMTPLAMPEPKFALSIHVEERDGNPVFAAQYDDSQYSPWLMERFADTLGMAMSGILAMPEAPVRNISLVSPQQAALLNKFNDTDAQLPETVLHQKFEAIAARNPQHIALVASDGSYSYAQLNAAANTLAHGLLALGLKAEDRVAFALPRTGHVIIAMLGILKAGGAYIPLDPEYPTERIFHVLNDSNAKYILTDGGEVADRLADFTGIINFEAVCAGQPETNPDLEITPDRLAYLIYTSGSTGKPKGVMLRHGGITNYVTAHERNPHVSALARHAHAMLSVTTVAFDMFLKESMTSLCNGVTLVLANDEETRDPLQLARLFASTGADAFNATPSRLMEYAAHPPLLAAMINCQVLMAGAEKYPETLLKKLRAGQGRLFNTYGPTEITVSCNCKELTNADKVTVGAPLLNTHEYVVDEDDNILPCGMIGELLVGGVGVAAGYNNLPDQSAARFINFANEHVYRTGDYARWTETGEIAILGRNDNQIKLRGLRIELGEVENVLASLPGVMTCVVNIRNINGQEHLCAWHTGPEKDSQMLRKQAASILPGYMTPTAWVHLESMPHLPNGKTDTRSLPDPETMVTGDYTAPATEVEKQICDIFATVLGLEKVSAGDSFFDLGGSSLAVARVLIEAERARLAGIAYADVFAHPTPQALASCLAKRDTPLAKTATPEIATREYKAIEELLRDNTLDAFRAGAPRPLGDVLLTGPTGFLGSHMLHNMLQCNEGAVYCLMRKGRYASVEQRLKQILYYYFEDDFDHLFGKRLFVLEGDIANATDLIGIGNMSDCHIDTIINCAANVSHFSAGSAITDVNLGGARNLIELALNRGARLVQISTASVAGFSINGEPAQDTRLTERDLYIGQNLDNQYVRSKFLAEKAILEAAINGLDAKIMRVGNLMARNRDGEFQINLRSNSFIGRLRAWHTVGGFPYSSFLHRVELAPVDSTAKAVLLLAAAPDPCRIFHPFNNHNLFMGDIVEAMREEGIEIPLMEDDDFLDVLNNARNDPTKAERLVSLLAYGNMADGQAAVPLAAESTYTAQVLLRYGWSWPETGNAYLRNFIGALVGMGFFDI